MDTSDLPQLDVAGVPVLDADAAPQVDLTDLPVVGGYRDMEAEAEANAPERHPGLSTDPRTVRRVEIRRMVTVARERAAIDQIGALPVAGEYVVLIMPGNFHGWDLVRAVLQLSECDAARLYVATLGFNKAQTNALAEMMDSGQVRDCRFLVSEMFRDKNRGEMEHLREAVESRGGRVGVNRNHCALLLLELTDGRKYAIRGSLNLRRCHSFEQVELSLDAGLFDFFAGYILESLAAELREVA